MLFIHGPCQAPREQRPHLPCPSPSSLAPRPAHLGEQGTPGSLGPVGHGEGQAESRFLPRCSPGPPFSFPSRSVSSSQTRRGEGWGTRSQGKPWVTLLPLVSHGQEHFRPVCYKSKATIWWVSVRACVHVCACVRVCRGQGLGGRENGASVLKARIHRKSHRKEDEVKTAFGRSSVSSLQSRKRTGRPWLQMGFKKQQLRG